MRRRRHVNPSKLAGVLEDRINQFMLKAERLAEFAWRLHSHLRAYPEISYIVHQVADVCDEAIEKLDKEMDEN